MLSFDIETEGLNMNVNRITVACIYDPDADIKRGFNFIVGSEEEIAVVVEEFLSHLDKADCLCSFNGARFDIPFIVKRFNVPHERYSKWFLKLFDYFEICKLVLGSTCSLNRLLEANGEETKTSTGAQAVQWAKEGNWGDLMDYCMADTILTHKISNRKVVTIQLTGVAHPVVCNHEFPTQEKGFHSLNFHVPSDFEK